MNKNMEGSWCCSPRPPATRQQFPMEKSSEMAQVSCGPGYGGLDTQDLFTTMQNPETWWKGHISLYASCV